MPHNTKSNAKRIGVKSAFSCKNGRLVITRFGRGNQAEVAVESDARGTELSLPYRVEKSFTVRDIDEEIGVERGELSAILENPADEVQQDYLGLKGTLEKMFFGKEFPNDTVRIQIIHNILDITKILGLYVNDIIYCISNLQKDETPDEFMGQNITDEKAKDILHNIAPYMVFFGDVFKIPQKKNRTTGTSMQKKNDDADEAYNISVLRILSTIRHQTVHFKSSKRKEKNIAQFLFDGNLTNNFYDSTDNKKTLTDYYEAFIKRINKDFLANSKMNLQILFEIFAAQTSADEKRIAEDYYRFSILKMGKNLGLNMRKLREIIVDTYYPKMKNKEHDSYRKKMYTILDYVLFNSVYGSEDLESMVAKLRETSDEDAKEDLYRAYAKKVWNDVQGLVLPFFSKLGTDFNFDAYSTEKTKISWIQDVQLSSENSEPIVQLLAFLCSFWDGKEVNELLSAYIHKFESIQSFLDVLEKVGDRATFTDPYQSFNEKGFAGRVAQQLRVLASIGKMKPEMHDARRALYKAALEMLGIQGHEDWISNAWLEENVLLGSSALKEPGKKQSTNPFRNFIANNVIESRRFIYLVRYSKPAAVRELMSNMQIVHYVLTRLPEAQIDTYYKNISETPDEEVPYNIKINRLMSRLRGFSFQSIQSRRSEIVQNSVLPPARKNVEIERLKALTGLYLTTAFVAVKNLVKANARYYIAFAAFERDYALLMQKDPGLQEIFVPFGEKGQNEIYALTEYYLRKEEENDYHPEPGKPFDREACRRHLDGVKRHFSKKWRDIFRSNIDEALQVSETGLMGIVARNHAAHLNALMSSLPKYARKFRARTPGMTSYFELYHFLIQKLMCENEGFTIPDAWRHQLEQGIPCSDWIKAAYVSLGYNLARYKNLTIEALFDKDSNTGKEMTARNLRKKS